jgi:Na+-driven multidrug efflux pump
MLLSLAGFLALALGLERVMGNDGLWCAFCCFMALRGVTLGLRLPGIERELAAASQAVNVLP